MTQTIEPIARGMDRGLLLLALFDAMNARRNPQSTDQLELRLFGLSGDWISRKLAEEFNRFGAFPGVGRLLTRWRNVERTRDRAALDQALEEGRRRGLWASTETAGRTEWRVVADASAVVEELLRDATR